MAANVCWNLAIITREVSAAFGSEMGGIVLGVLESNIAGSLFFMHDPPCLPTHL